MIRIRRVEETLAELYPAQEMRTPTHFSIGQEAVAVGVCGALRRDDVVYSGHRCHAHYLAKGGDLRGMVAELYGRETAAAGPGRLGPPERSRGRAHRVLRDPRRDDRDGGGHRAGLQDGRPRRVAVTFFGDGTVEEGIFHERLNFAVMRRAGALRLREQRLLDPHAALEVRQPAKVPDLEAGRRYGMQAAHVDGNDVFAVHEAAREAVAHMRRWRRARSSSSARPTGARARRPLRDHDKGYRTKAEVESWIARCPIRRRPSG